MHGDWVNALYTVGALLIGTGLSAIFGLWLIGALIWGKPGFVLWCLGLASWGWWACVAGRLLYLRLTGQPL